MTPKFAIARCLLVVAAFSISCAHAEDFYKNKQLRLIAGFPAGNDYDLGARLLVKYLPKYIPGQPNIIVQNMPQAASIVAANYLYAQAPKDGTAWGVVTQTLAIEEALRSPAVRYKAVEFTWIGRISSALEVYFTWKTSKAKTIEDARLYETPVAGTV